MASWILVPCLVTLRSEFNTLAPSRDKSSDGSIGDSAHASSSSDHNPDETGTTPYEDADNTNEVHAIDVDIDLHKSGWTMEKAVQIIVTRHRNDDDDRLQNVIYNRRIWSRSWGWTAREYTGSNPHDHHAHFSSRYTTAAESNTRPWGLLEEQERMEDDGMANMTQADFNARMDAWAETENGRKQFGSWDDEFGNTVRETAGQRLANVDAAVDQLKTENAELKTQVADLKAGQDEILRLLRSQQSGT